MRPSQKALVLGGKTGLVGQALMESLHNSGWEAIAIGRADVDIFDKDASDKLQGIMDKYEPNCFFNTVAYTQVDAAEQDEENATLLNRTLPAILGRLVKARSCTLVHYSTDFVFDGKKRTPYGEDDLAAPQSVYGKTKLAGEVALQNIGVPHCLIIRTAWLFGPGRGNFISAILERCRAKQEIRVVHDQVGSPTYSLDLAQYTLKLLESGVSGLFHIVNSGQASKCELADEAIDLVQLECAVTPVPTSEFALAAPRPPYSVLDCAALTRVTGVSPRPWPQALRDYIYKDFAAE